MKHIRIIYKYDGEEHICTWTASSYTEKELIFVQRFISDLKNGWNGSDYSKDEFKTIIKLSKDVQNHVGIIGDNLWSFDKTIDILDM